MTSRVQDGRDRARKAKQTLACIAVAAFATALGLARETHPGGATSSSSGVATSPAAATSEQDQTDAFDFGDGSVQSSPSGALPQVESSVS